MDRTQLLHTAGPQYQSLDAGCQLSPLSLSHGHYATPVLLLLLLLLLLLSRAECSRSASCFQIWIQASFSIQALMLLHAALIYKKGKDLLRADSYRPISLLNVDTKILAKALSGRLARVVQSIVHQDQSGFMPNRSTCENIRRVYLNMQLPCDNLEDRALLSLDVAKAFDCVEWEYLWEVLTVFGFGLQFIRYIQVLYANPKAKISVNGYLFQEITLSRGTRQGCPLSPLLFAIAMEPLALLIRSDPLIEGFRRGDHEEKIILYADDTLLFLADTKQSLTQVIRILTQFERYSGLGVNWGKSTLLKIDVPEGPLPDHCREIQLVQTFKYLGIWIRINPSLYFEDNITPLLKKFRSQSKSWSRLPLSVVGRCNLIKMVWLPQLMYALQNSPCWIPRGKFKEIDSIFRSLIWRGKQARIKLQNLQQSKINGGLAVPDPWVYFLALQLRHVAGWRNREEGSSTYNLIKMALKGMDPIGALESGFSSWSQDKWPNRFSIGFMMSKLWNVVKNLMNISGYLEYTPLWANRIFPEVNKLSGFKDWERAGINRLIQIYEQGNLMAFHELQSKFNLPNTQFYKYLQLRHALMGSPGIRGVEIGKSEVLEELLQVIKFKGLVSIWYTRLLIQVQRTVDKKSRSKWETDVGPMDDKMWEGALRSVQFVSTSESHRLTQIFILHRAYRTPEFLCRIGYRQDAKCPKCGIEPGSLIHLLWRCPKLERYWLDILEVINRVFECELSSCPLICILGIVGNTNIMLRERVVIMKLLHVARRLIMMKWISEVPPTLEDWFKETKKICRFERLSALHRGVKEKYELSWIKWLTVYPV